MISTSFNSIKGYLYTSILFITSVYLHGQENKGIIRINDSLVYELSKKNTVKEKVDICYALIKLHGGTSTEKGTKWIHRAKRIAKEWNDPSLLARINSSLITKYARERSISKIEDLIAEIETDNKKYNTDTNKGLVELGRGNLSMLNYKLEEAKKHFKKCLEYLESSEAEAIHVSAVSHLTIGFIYMRQYNYKLTLEHYLKADEFYSKTKDPYLMAFSQYTIASVYGTIKDYKKSQEYILKSWEVLKKNDKSTNYTKAVTILITSYIGLKQYEEAEKLLHSVENHFKDSDSKKYIYFLDMKAQLHISKKEYHRSLEFLNRTYAIMKKNPDNYYGNFAIIIHSIALNHYRLGNYKKSRNFAKQITMLDVKHRTAKKIMDSHEILYKLDSIEGNFESSLKNYKAYKFISDSLSNVNDEVAISELQSKYETKEKDYEIAQLELKNKEQEIASRKQKTGLMLIGLLLLTFMSIAFFLYKNYKTKVKNNLKLRENQAKLNNALMDKELLIKEIHHRVKNNLQFIISLLTIQADSIKRKSQEIRDYLEKTESRIYSMAILHEILYESELHQIDFKEYLQKLILTIKNTHPAPHIDYLVNLQPIFLSIENSITLGFVAHEIILNALKHAFINTKKGEIIVDLTDNNGAVELIVTDTGNGFLEEHLNTNNNSFGGLELVALLAEQLNATITKSNELGHTFRLTFIPNTIPTPTYETKENFIIRG